LKRGWEEGGGKLTPPAGDVGKKCRKRLGASFITVRTKNSSLGKKKKKED